MFLTYVYVSIYAICLNFVVQCLSLKIPVAIFQTFLQL